ncbi:MAG: hypothetical protein A3G81_15770 [Betaproteobacteria bacterium RIFCSPLOWO2_12_FULL_65_14]|nr:MAG: hypothetical protein A3G81_15770 [Betaproteobacteria bacterium RIFCSPLOWO2_12_FULL_65_14]
MGVPHMRANRQLDGGCLEVASCSRTTDPPRVLLAAVFGNRLSFLDWTGWEQFRHALREALDVLGVERLPPFGGALAGQSPRFGVGQALLLRSRERPLFDQHALPLVAPPRTAEAHDDRAQRRIARGTPSERGVPARQEHEMIQIRTSEAQRPFPLEAKKAPLAKFFATFRAG